MAGDHLLGRGYGIGRLATRVELLAADGMAHDPTAVVDGPRRWQARREVGRAESGVDTRERGDDADQQGRRVDRAAARASTSAPREHQSEPGEEEPDAVTDPMTSTSCLHQVPPLADGCRRLIVDDRSDNHGS